LIWPWSRFAEYEQRCSEAEARARANNALANAASDIQLKLLEMIHRKDALIAEMKREGFDPPKQAPTVEQRSPRETLPRAVLSVVDGLCEPETREHYAMQADAARMLKGGMSEEEVVADLQRGSALSPHWL